MPDALHFEAANVEEERVEALAGLPQLSSIAEEQEREHARIFARKGGCHHNLHGPGTRS